MHDLSTTFERSKEVWENNLRLFPHTKLNYPAESLVRLLSGRYIPIPSPPARLMDHGFGHGNNLLFASDKGYDCAGCEISHHLVREVSDLFYKLEKKADLRLVNGIDIPFEDNSFDLVISWDVIHYNGTREAVSHVIEELYRVLCPKGVLLLSTVNPESSIFDRMKPLGKGTYEIVDESPYDNRKGLTFFVADSAKDLINMFSMFDKVKHGKLYHDLFNFKKRHAAYLIYGIKG